MIKRFLYTDERVLSMVDNDTTTYSYSDIHVLVDTISNAYIFFAGKGIDISGISELMDIDNVWHDTDRTIRVRIKQDVLLMMLVDVTELYDYFIKNIF